MSPCLSALIPHPDGHYGTLVRQPRPCSSNVIHVELQTNVDLLNTCGDVDGIGNGVFPRLTISGLVGTKSSAPSNLTSPQFAFNNFSGGVLTFTPLDVIHRNASYVFTFNVTNQETGQPAQSLSITADTLTHDFEPMTSSALDTSSPMYIISPRVLGHANQTTVHQSSANPCAVNSIRITITTNVPIFAACSPALTISGLNSSSTPDLSNSSDLSALQGSPSVTGTLAIQSWTRSTGVLVLAVDTIDLGNAETQFSFHFELLNPSKHQNASGIHKRTYACTHLLLVWLFHTHIHVCIRPCQMVLARSYLPGLPLVHTWGSLFRHALFCRIIRLVMQFYCMEVFSPQLIDHSETSFDVVVCLQASTSFLGTPPRGPTTPPTMALALCGGARDPTSHPRMPHIQ